MNEQPSKQNSTSLNFNGYPNEAVNFKKQALYIAIPKTGSTSVRIQLKQPAAPFIANDHLNIRQVRDLIYPFLLSQISNQHRSFPDEASHTDQKLRSYASDIFHSLFKFASVRNPWARAVSLYFRREGISTHQAMTFEVFCENHYFASDTCLQPSQHINQYDWLCDEQGILLMDYVYKIEDFDAAIPIIVEKTDGRLLLKPIHTNKNPKSVSSHYRELYNNQTRKLIAQRFEKDIAYFKYTF